MVFGTIYIPFVKLFLIFGFITSFFGLVRLFKHLDAISLVFVATVLTFAMLVLLPISGIMSSLYDMSKDFSRNVSAQIKTERVTKKILESELKSCFAIRCTVGNLYHMESEAKLTLLHQVVNGLVFLLTNSQKSLCQLC